MFQTVFQVWLGFALRKVKNNLYIWYKQMPRPPARGPRRPRRKAAAPRRPRSTVPTQVVRGRGFYKGFGRDLGTAVGAAAGGAGMFYQVPGMNPGTGIAVGRALGSMVSHATGFGAYKLRHNSILMGDVPSVRNARNLEGAVVVRHKEYLGDVTSSSTAGSAAITVYPLNPGLSTFPWLAGIANSFQEYKWNGVLVEFKTTCGDAISSTNSALGEVVISTNYNSVSPFTTSSTKSQLLNEEYATSTKPSMSAIHAIECAPTQSPLTRLYTRGTSTNVAATGADLRLYDLGSLAVGTFGQQAASATLGELWITYEVILFKPRINV